MSGGIAPACPKCGGINRPGADVCYLCREPLGAGPGVNAFVGGSPAPAVARPPLRPIPMLLFTEAARHNVRMSILLFALLFAVFHYPNLVLTVGVVPAYLVWASFFWRRPNIWALTISHAVLGPAMGSWVADGYWAGMAVGPSLFDK